jgi:hypothetical protein
LKVQEIVLELRNSIASAAPDAVEVVRWGDLGYFHAGRGGLVSAGICQIEIRKDRVLLAFIHGAFLSDPHGLLEGTQKAKRVVRIESYEDAPWEHLQELIVSASKFDPRSLGN